MSDAYVVILHPGVEVRINPQFNPGSDDSEAL
jgi:hypothetical protein